MRFDPATQLTLDPASGLIETAAIHLLNPIATAADKMMPVLVGPGVERVI